MCNVEQFHSKLYLNLQETKYTKIKNYDEGRFHIKHGRQNNIIKMDLKKYPHDKTKTGRPERWSDVITQVTGKKIDYKSFKQKNVEKDGRRLRKA